MIPMHQEKQPGRPARNSKVTAKVARTITNIESARLPTVPRFFRRDARVALNGKAAKGPVIKPMAKAALKRSLPPSSKKNTAGKLGNKQIGPKPHPKKTAATVRADSQPPDAIPTLPSATSKSKVATKTSIENIKGVGGAALGRRKKGVKSSIPARTGNQFRAAEPGLNEKEERLATLRQLEEELEEEEENDYTLETEYR